MTITLSLDLTAKNWKLLQELMAAEVEPCENLSKPCENLSAPIEKPAELPPEPYVEEPPHEAPAKTYSKTDVKAVCLQFSKAGRQDELRAVFAKFGAKKLTEINEADYPALMEALGNA